MECFLLRIARSLLIRAAASLGMILSSADPSFAQPIAPAASRPVHVPASGGEVVFPNERQRSGYDRVGFAPVRRVGDLLFISGVIVARNPGEGTDVASFKNEARRAFRHIQQVLAAAGASFDDVVMINSFHVWKGPDFAGTRDEQFEAFEQVKEEFMHSPNPAWTAVGSSGLLGQGGIVEVQMIAYAPRRPR